MTLALNCAAVYSLSIFISILLIDKNFISRACCISVLLTGSDIFLTAVLYKIYALYPTILKGSPEV